MQFSSPIAEQGYDILAGSKPSSDFEQRSRNSAHHSPHERLPHNINPDFVPNLRYRNRIQHAKGICSRLQFFAKCPEVVLPDESVSDFLHCAYIERPSKEVGVPHLERITLSNKDAITVPPILCAES